MNTCFKIELDNDVIWEDIDSYDVLNGNKTYSYSFHRLQGSFFKVKRNSENIINLKYKIDAPLSFWKIMNNEIQDYYISEDKKYTFWIPFENTNVKL